MMITLENKLAGGVGLPNGQVIPGNSTAEVEEAAWADILRHPVTSALLADGSLVQREEATGEVVTPPSSETPEEMRVRYEAELSNLQTQLFNANERAFEAERLLSYRDAEIATLKAEQAPETEETPEPAPEPETPAPEAHEATSGYVVKDKGRGWFVITKDGEDITKSLREIEVEGFDALSDDEKAAFVNDNPPSD